MRNSYHTQQRCALLAFLSAHADEQFTVEQLLAAMGDEAPTQFARLSRGKCKKSRRTLRPTGLWI